MTAVARGTCQLVLQRGRGAVMRLSNQVLTNLFRKKQIQTQIELAVFVQTANCLRQMSANQVPLADFTYISILHRWLFKYCFSYKVNICLFSPPLTNLLFSPNITLFCLKCYEVFWVIRHKLKLPVVHSKRAAANPPHKKCITTVASNIV